MAVQQVQSKGIFHGLPVYPSELSGLTAIITGANGISGQYMLKVLLEGSTRWKRIICLSRRPPVIPKNNNGSGNVHHVPVDFLNSPQAIADILRANDVSADYIFYFSYLQPAPKPGEGPWNNEALVKPNVQMLDNFLQSLRLAEAVPKRFLLQTGGKYYGTHLGPAKMPQVESDPQILLEPNFYYPQEGILTEFCKETGCEWNITMPGPIVGAVQDAAMNVAYGLATYAAISKHLGKPLEFPGDINSWQMPLSMSSAQLDAYHEEWAVLMGPANEKLNSCDTSAFTWEHAWPRIAGWYGIGWSGPNDNDKYTETETPFNPRGYGPKGIVRRKFSLTEWSAQEDVRHTWASLVEKYSLKQTTVPDLAFTDVTISRAAPLFLSMDKSRKLGWHGFVDSVEAFLGVFDALAKLNLLPPVPVGQANLNGPL